MAGSCAPRSLSRVFGGPEGGRSEGTREFEGGTASCPLDAQRRVSRTRHAAPGSVATGGSQQGPDVARLATTKGLIHRKAGPETHLALQRGGRQVTSRPQLAAVTCLGRLPAESASSPALGTARVYHRRGCALGWGLFVGWLPERPGKGRIRPPNNAMKLTRGGWRRSGAWYPRVATVSLF